MKKGQIYEGIVRRIDFPNKGIVETVEGESAVVKNVLPGQKISFQVTKKRSQKSEGRLLEVLEKNDTEIEPACEHFAECGGCSYQNLPYEEQLKIKEGQVKYLLRQPLEEAGYQLDDLFEGIKGSPVQFGYRNKMEFSFGDQYKDGPVALGMHRRGSFYDIVPVHHCQIVDEDYRMVLQATEAFFQERNVSFYHKMRHVGVLRHLLVRKAVKTQEMMVALVTSTQEQIDLEGWKNTLLSLPLKGKFAAILHIANDSLADVVQSDETTCLYGQPFFYEELLGLKFRITPFSFFQTNSLGAEVLYSTVREYLGDISGVEGGSTVFDLYSGTGTIAQIIAPVAKKVIGVEIVEEAVVAARENAALNGLDNCEFIAGDVLKMLDTIEEKPDFIILDPPRDGIHPKALQKIVAYGVEKMIYISCKPTSLARDLPYILAHGYQPERIVSVDMFPGTTGIETVVLLSKGVVDKDNFRKVKVDFSLEDMDLTELRGKATYAQVKEYILNEFGLKVSSLYIAQVKKKCGLEVGENYNLPKSEGARQPQVTPEKEEAIMKAFRHFGVI